MTQLRPAMRVLLISCVLVLLDGCYYMQAIGGQMELMKKRRPVAEVVDDDATDVVLRERLLMVQEARRFAIDQLLLPDNGSYESYADLQRDFVVWNVFAAPEFSLEARQWCYPIAGCVAYRGYFSEHKARKKAASLSNKGFDVFVGGVAAYSTLGRFEDPVLNTMMRWSDAHLIRTLFHELAHQKLYVSGDTAFNESFASAVAEFGMQRWFAAGGAPTRITEHDIEIAARSVALQEEVRVLVADARQALGTVFISESEDAAKRGQKEDILGGLSQSVQAAIDDAGLQIRNWLAAPLNNARLVSSGVYENNLPAFRAIMVECEQGLACFYSKTDEIARLEFDERQYSLARYTDNSR